MLTAEDIRKLAGDPLPPTGVYLDKSYRPYYELRVGSLQFHVWRRVLDHEEYFDIILRLEIEWLNIDWDGDRRKTLSKSLMFQAVADFLNNLKTEELQGLADSILKLQTNGPIPQRKSALTRIDEEEL